MKRWVSLLFALVLLLSFNGLIFAESASGYEFRIEKDGTATITRYVGNDTALEIPTEIEGAKVAAIGNAAFHESLIKSIIIPEGISSIGGEAFYGSGSLTNITLPSTLTYIGEYAFDGCNLTGSIKIPAGVTELRDMAFRFNPNLSEIILHDNITSIGDYCLADTCIDSFEFPKNLTTLGINVFGNTEIKDLIIPNTVKSIAQTQTNEYSPSGFRGVTQLKTLVLPYGLSKMHDDFIVYCPKLEMVAIPKSVTVIKDSNFDNCYSVTIHGVKGSAAQTYAKKKNIPFVAVDLTKDIQLLLDNEDITKGKLSLDLNSGSTLQLCAQTFPLNPWPGVTWKSSDAKTAAVDRDGLLTGLKKGKATITATAVDGSGKKASFQITITRLAHEIIIEGENEVKAGKKIKLIATVLPETTDNKEVGWSTSDKTIATVDTSGNVTTKKVKEEQEVTITATAKDGSGITAEFVVIIKP